MGEKLTEARANTGKIMFRTALRLILAGVIILAGVRSNPPGKPADFLAGLLALLIFLAAAAWVFFPLYHFKDYIIFYEHGLELRGKSWTLNELGAISFMESKSNYSLFSRTYLCTDIRNFDITYIKDAKKNYNRAYFETV